MEELLALGLGTDGYYNRVPGLILDGNRKGTGKLRKHTREREAH